MNKFYIITNSEKDKELAVTEQIAEYLRKNGCVCHLQQEQKKAGDSYHYTNPELIPEDTECIIVLGGDGTMLQGARDVVHKNIPLFGINLGTLGFLAEVDRQSVYPALHKLMEDDYEVEERMMLKGTVYSLSAGGPVVSPGASMMIMTPIAPHTMNTRSIIFPAEDVITVEIGRGRHQDSERGVASFDGDAVVPMITGDKIVIQKASVKTKILKLNHLSFVEVLRQKMQNS